MRSWAMLTRWFSPKIRLQLLEMEAFKSQEAVDKQVTQIRNLVEAADLDCEKEKLNERNAKFSGVVAVIQAAFEEGIVVGGGCTLLGLSSKFDAIKETLDNDEQKVEADIVKRALSCPLK